MSRQMVAKVPQVHGNLLESMNELIEGLGLSGDGVRGKEKFWIMRKCPGFAGFGMMEMGEDWKGPSSCSRMSCENGPACAMASNDCH